MNSFSPTAFLLFGGACAVGIAFCIFAPPFFKALFRGLKGQTRIPTDAPQPLQVALNLSGTEPFRGNPEFLKAFGLNVAQLKDVRFVKGPVTANALPPEVKSQAERLFHTGSARGPDIAKFLFSSTPLKENQCVYFALHGDTKETLSVTTLISSFQP
ncbi:hypothetical protein LC612_41070 [Nostoc sp. CHAB 5834]|nr:hypothetical protein [Nostoc sp. CHAB 5834]